MTDSGSQRNTQQRRMILQELRGLTWHPTAAELYQKLRQDLPRISLGTIYRNLELLVKNGTIQKLETSGGKARFDGNPERHDHLRCVRCGELKDLHGLPLEVEDIGLWDLGGYEIYGYLLEFIGICPACRAVAGTNNGRGIASPHSLDGSSSDGDSEAAGVSV